MNRPVFKTSLSLSANGTCKTNLRGNFVNGGFVYDFINPPFDAYGRITAEYQNLSSVATPGDTTWNPKIKFAYNATSDGASYPNIRYVPTSFSSSRSGTILIRIYVKQQTGTPIWPQYVLSNGASQGFGIMVDTPGGRNPRVFFVPTDTPANGIEISNGGIDYDTWNFFAVTFDTVDDGITATTTINSWHNSTKTRADFILASPILSPSGDCCLFDKGGLIGQRFFGQITDFSFFDKILASEQILTFAQVGYT